MAIEGGWSDYKVKPSDRGRQQVVGDYIIDRSDIPGYFTPSNIDKINMFWAYKTLGLPFSGGWAEQPAYFIDIVIRLDNELGKKQKNGRKG